MPSKALPTHCLPTLVAAQQAGLQLSPRPWWDFWSPQGKLKTPLSQRRVAALSIDAKLLIRSERVSIENVGPKLLAELPHSAPSEAGTDARYLKSLIDTSPTACSFCSTSKGRVTCTVCGGDGYMILSAGDGVADPAPVSCSGCSGKGWFECGACDGTGRTQRVEIVWLEDRREVLQYLFFPRLRFGLENAARAMVNSNESWPDDLAISLIQRLTSGPYRSRSNRHGQDADEQFHGYNVEEAIEKARAQVKALSSGGELLEAEVQAWALPLVHLHYGKRIEALLYMKPGQGIDIIVE